MDSNELQRLDEAASAYQTETGRFDAENVNHFTVELARRYSWEGNAIQMGLGNGLVAAKLAPMFAEFHIIEGSDVVIKQYGDPAAPYTVEKVLFEQFHPHHPYDVLFGNHVLEHVDDPVEILRLSRRWLRKGGKAMFTVPNATSLHRRIGVEMGLLAKMNTLNEQDIRLGHRRVYTVPELRADVESSGYRITEVQGYMLKVVSNRQMREWPRELMEACFSVSLTLPAEYCSNLAIFCENS